jgi:hypothetical protein
MDAVTDRYERRLYLRHASGSGPYLGRYGLVDETQAHQEVRWVDLMKWWPTEREALEDAARAARFAIDAELYRAAATRAVEAVTLASTLDNDAPAWSLAVRAERAAIVERDALESRLVGARELHWPSPALRRENPSAMRCR